MADVHRFYGELAPWWPLISPVDDSAEEAAEFVRVLRGAAPQARTLLELGSGGGHNAFHMKSAFRLTLSDQSAAMLEVSRRLNPECEHVEGDMRSLDLGRGFDCVFVHDAVDYMTSEDDLAAAMATAWRHLRPGGVALFVPDDLRESFVAGTDCGGSDGEGVGVRFLSWTLAPAADDARVTTLYTFLLREADGTVRSLTETHVTGLFATATWLRLFAAQGFTVDVVAEVTGEDRPPRSLFLARRP